MWAGAEQQLAARAREYRPRELAGFARDLITTLDQDGPEPDHGDEAQVNELYLATRPGGAGGRITGVFDAPSFDALRHALDALAKPTAEDQRRLAERRGDGLAELCRQRLDAADLPMVGGQRPHLTVTVPLAELETRARRRCSTTAARSPPRSCGCWPAKPVSSPSCSTGTGSHWTSAGPAGSYPATYAARSPPATAAAPSPAADAHRAGATPTT